MTEWWSSQRNLLPQLHTKEDKMQKPTNIKADMKDHKVKRDGRDNCAVCVLFTIFLVFVFMFVMICIGVVYIQNLQTNLVNLEKRVRDLERQSSKHTIFKVSIQVYYCAIAVFNSLYEILLDGCLQRKYLILFLYLYSLVTSNH